LAEKSVSFVRPVIDLPAVDLSDGYLCRDGNS
jgi:hypothetical protein